VSGCNKIIAAGCFDGEWDAGLSQCALCIGLYDYQAAEIAQEYSSTHSNMPIPKADIARMMDECLAKTTDRAKMDKCFMGAFLYTCPTPPCNP
jgi:hypothetical protein